MILSTLAESGRVEHLHPAFKLVFTRVRDKDCVKNRVKRANIVRSTLC